MDYQTLLFEVDNGTCTLTINRPEKLNAINEQVMTDLHDALIAIESDENIRSVIITGAGEKSFVAGADIKEFLGLNADQGKDVAKRGQDIFFKIENFSKPVIAAVNGFALGGGCELAMACHFRVASEAAKFGQPEVNLGLIPGYGATQRLVQLVGKGRALEMLMTGNLIDAQRAHAIGLVNHVVPQAELISFTKSILATIHKKAPLAIQKCITAANAVYGTEGYQVELDGFGDCFETEDMKEGTAAFLEKRPANFTGK